MKLDRWNKIYDTGHDFSVMSELLLDRILSEANVSSGNALDLGCGTGDLAVKMARRGFNVLGVDGSIVALDLARQRADKAGQKIYFSQSDLDGDLQGLSKDYDLIICKLVLAFVADKAKFMGHLRRLLGPEGHFILITPVLLPGRTYSPRIQSISIIESDLNDLLQQYFPNSKLMHEQYFEDFGLERTYLGDL